MRKSKKIILTAVLLINIGCASSPLHYPGTAPDPEPNKQDSPRFPATEPQQEQRSDQSNGYSDGSSPAVLALLDAAESDRQQGNLGSAVATIERALRIQPRNAGLWYRLAELRLEQEQPKLAENLARKSNTLAGSDLTLIQRNWLLIASAQRLLGNLEAADEAERKAAQVNP